MAADMSASQWNAAEFSQFSPEHGTGHGQDFLDPQLLYVPAPGEGDASIAAPSALAEQLPLPLAPARKYALVRKVAPHKPARAAAAGRAGRLGMRSAGLPLDEWFLPGVRLARRTTPSSRCCHQVALRGTTCWRSRRAPSPCATTCSLSKDRRAPVCPRQRPGQRFWPSEPSRAPFAAACTSCATSTMGALQRGRSGCGGQRDPYSGRDGGAAACCQEAQASGRGTPTVGSRLSYAPQLTCPPCRVYATPCGRVSSPHAFRGAKMVTLPPKAARLPRPVSQSGLVAPLRNPCI